MNTFYEFFKVSEDATIEEITEVYNKLKNKYESYLSDPERREKAEQVLKKLDIAYKVLGNEENKIKYDKDLITMRNNELINNLQKNTNDYNEELQKVEKQKLDAEENIRKQKEKEEVEAQNKRRAEAIQEVINQQINAQKEKFQSEVASKKILEEQIKKEYKKRARKQKTKKVRDLLVFIISLCVVIFILSKIPFIRDYFSEQIQSISYLFG